MIRSLKRGLGKRALRGKRAHSRASREAIARELASPAVFLLKDFSCHLDDAATAREFRELLQLLAQSRSTVVITGESVRLPSGVSHHAYWYELPLPGIDELHGVVRSVVGSLKKVHKISVRTKEDEYAAILRALGGLTLSIPTPKLCTREPTDRGCLRPRHRHRTTSAAERTRAGALAPEDSVDA